MYSVNQPLLWTIAGVFAALTGGTLVRIVALQRATEDVVHSRMSSLRTWWILAIAVSIAVVAGRNGIIILLAVAAVLGLRELLALIGWTTVGRSTVLLAFFVVPVYYALLLMKHDELVRQAAPAVFVMAIGAVRAWLGLVDGYVRTTAAVIWALLLLLYGLSHAAMLLALPNLPVPMVGQVGWFLFLILLTETNDIMQAITGRKFGRTKLTPRVSPNKSLEGLLGGMSATMLLAAVTAPWLTGLTEERSQMSGILVSLIAGLLISLFGFLGDINMSGIKRDAGVKDGSRLLPGQGGIIDRVDSLTFTAPVFFYFVRLVSSPE